MADRVPARTRLFQVLAIALAVGVASLLIWQASRPSEPETAPARSADDVAPATAVPAGAAPAEGSAAPAAPPAAPSTAAAQPATPKPDAATAPASPRPDVGNRIAPVEQALYLDTSKSGDFSGLAIGLAGVGPDAGATEPDGGAAKPAPKALEFERVGDPYWETSKSGGGLFRSNELE